MRLTPEQIERIRDVARRVLGDDARVTLFGSRADDRKKGGDIDLYFETDAILANRAQTVCRLYAALVVAARPISSSRTPKRRLHQFSLSRSAREFRYELALPEREHRGFQL